MALIPHIDAKNAYYARYKIMQLYTNETYFMQIDSHIRFVPNWDTEHIKMIHNCDYREKSIITVYPCSFTIKNQTDGWEVEINRQHIVQMNFKEFRNDQMPAYEMSYL